MTERLASQPTQSRLMETLTHTADNRAALRDALGESCVRNLRTTVSEARQEDRIGEPATSDWCASFAR